MGAKAKLFLQGHKGLMRRIREACEGQEGIAWFHVASLGEFEAARPVMETLRRRDPSKKILLTFFSPSGYELKKDYKGADWVFYMPLDTPCNARRFLDIVRPVKALFFGGEYWLCFLAELKRRGVDTYLAYLRITDHSTCTKWYGGAIRRALRTKYTALLLLDEQSVRRAESFGCRNAFFGGDPRVDAVASVVDSEWSNAVLEKWLGGAKPFVAGSTMPGEDNAVMIALANARTEGKILIVPHDPNPEIVEFIMSSLTCKAIRYTEAQNCTDLETYPAMVLDTVGMLSRLYRYAFAAYIGEGFLDSGLHSVLEPAAYGMPVIVGPKYWTDVHALALYEKGGVLSIASAEELISTYDRLISDKEETARMSEISRRHCDASRGATDSIIARIFG